MAKNISAFQDITLRRGICISSLFSLNIYHYNSITEHCLPFSCYLCSNVLYFSGAELLIKLFFIYISPISVISLHIKSENSDWNNPIIRLVNGYGKADCYKTFAFSVWLYYLLKWLLVPMQTADRVDAGKVSVRNDHAVLAAFFKRILQQSVQFDKNEEKFFSGLKFT